MVAYKRRPKLSFTNHAFKEGNRLTFGSMGPWANMYKTVKTGDLGYLAGSWKRSANMWADLFFGTGVLSKTAKMLGKTPLPKGDVGKFLNDVIRYGDTQALASAASKSRDAALHFIPRAPNGMVEAIPNKHQRDIGKYLIDAVTDKKIKARVAERIALLKGLKKKLFICLNKHPKIIQLVHLIETIINA